MSRWAEVWTQPETGTFERVIADLPWSRVGANRALSQIGGGSVEVPASYPRLNEVIEPDTYTGSLIRLFETGSNVASFYAEEVEFDEERQGSVTINGQGIESSLESGQVYPWDWEAGSTETKFPDWVYGLGSNEIPDPDFEDDPHYPLTNGDAEEGDTSGWSTFSKGDEDTTLEIINNPTEAYEGNFYFEVDPGSYHSGIKQSGLTVYPGKRNQFTARIKEEAASSRRYTFGATVAKGASRHGLNQFYYDGTVMAELDNVASNGVGTPGGSSDGTWQELNLDITWGPKQESTDLFVQFDHHKLSDGPVYWVDGVTMAGFGVGTGDWEPTHLEDTNTFEGSTDYFHSGTRSLKVGVDANTRGYGGVRRYVSFEEGAPYYAEAWVYATVDTDISLSARQVDESVVIGTERQVISAGTWTKLTLEFNPPEGIFLGKVVVISNETTASTFYVDDVVTRTGLAPRTAGYILKEHMDLITARDGADSALTWVKYDSFTALVDSNGEAWPEEMAIRVPRGQSVRQLLDQLKQWGYEWEMIWNEGLSTYELKFYTKFDGTNGGAGEITDVALVSGKSFRKGTVRLRDPGANTFLAEGMEGSLHEKSSAVLVSNYGRREGYLPQPRTEESVTLESMIDAAIVASQNQKYGVKASLFERPFPVIDFQVGDRVGVNLPPHLPDDQYRVIGFTLVWTAEDETSYTLDFSSNVFDQPFGGTTSSSTSAGLNYLLGKFESMPDVDRLKLSITAGDEPPKESVPTMMVTAWNCRTEVTNHGDIECGGSGDMESIQVACDELEAYGQGRLILSEGDFLVDSASELSIASAIKVSGVGMYLTRILYPAYGTPPSITCGSNVEITDLTIDEDEECCG